MIASKYGILFTVELLHKFFADQLCRDFSIVPSAQTKEVLAGHKIIAKQYDNRLYAGVQTDGTGKPFVIPEEGMQLSFFVQLNNPLFFNYTNLPFAYTPGKLYYFTNRNTNGSNNKNFLSIGNAYNASVTYKPGDLAINASGTVFESIRTSTGVAPPADGVASDFWMQVDAPASRNRYMSEADALQWLPFKSTYRFASPQSSASLQVHGYNAAAGDYSSLVLSQTISFSKPANAFTLDLSALPTGKYRLAVNGTAQAVYLSDEPGVVNAFAVIDIFCEATLATGYQLLDGSSQLKSPLYSVYFLNRATIWKYVLPSGIMGGITDNASVYQFTTSSPASGTVYSVKPIPLNEKALSLKLTIGSHDYSPIECASPGRLTSITLSGDAYCCSEIFLNYTS